MSLGLFSEVIHLILVIPLRALLRLDSFGAEPDCRPSVVHPAQDGKAATIRELSRDHNTGSWGLILPAVQRRGL